MQIRYLESRDHDTAVESESGEHSLAEAIAYAEATVQAYELAERPAWRSVVIGFVIDDDDGKELYRHYRG